LRHSLEKKFAIVILFHCDAIKVAIKLKQATLCHKGDPCLSVHHKTLETFEKNEKEKIHRMYMTVARSHGANPMNNFMRVTYINSWAHETLKNSSFSKNKTCLALNLLSIKNVLIKSYYHITILLL
jgi:hypothetical protein